MVKLVAYLAGADYKVRDEQEVSDSDIDTEEKRRKVEQELIERLIQDYGKYWKNSTKKKVVIAKKIRIVKKEFEQRIVLKGKNYGIRKIVQKERTYRRWTRREEERLLILFRQGKNYRQIQRATKRTYESVRSRLLRMIGKKKNLK